MLQQICENQNGIQLTLMGAYVVLEYWLGRTTKTKSGSALEAIILTAQRAILWITKRRQ